MHVSIDLDRLIGLSFSSLFQQRGEILSNKETLSLGPSIELEFKIENQLIEHIHLSLSDSPGLKWSILSTHCHTNLRAQIQEWLVAYTHHQLLPFRWPLNWAKISPFTRLVLETLLNIPFGKDLSYKQVAQLIQKQHAYRAVGNACGRNPFLLIVPCHRVLATNKVLGGFSGGIEIKKRLLAFEGISYEAC